MLGDPARSNSSSVNVNGNTGHHDSGELATSTTTPTQTPITITNTTTQTDADADADESSTTTPHVLSTSITLDQNTNTNTDTNTIRSPSPRKLGGNTIMLGLGLPPTTPTAAAVAPPTPTPSLTLSQYPHLGHYIYSLLQTSFLSPPRAVSSGTAAHANTGAHSHAHTAHTHALAQQHPLSVSSSGESDGSDDESPSPPLPLSASSEQGQQQQQHQTPKKKRVSETSTSSSASAASGTGAGVHAAISRGVTSVDRDALVRKIVELIDGEEEEEVKEVLKPYMGELGKDEILMDQVCLDCMHRRKDDVEQVPYAPHLALTPTRARGSPNVNTLPLRPFTPTRMPSFRNVTPIGRPLSPGIPARPQTPTIAHPSTSLSPAIPPPVAPSSSSGQSSGGSPIISPRMLNAKATTFNPSPRPSPRITSGTLTSGSSSFAPSDPWKDMPADPPRSASPFGAIGPAMTRTGSNLAIAAPLFSDQSSPFHSPLGTPNRTPIKMPDVFSSPSPAVSVTRPSRGILPEDDDDDEFSPFGKGLPKLHHHEPSILNTGAKPFEPFGAGGMGGTVVGDYFASSSGDSSSRASLDSSGEPTFEELNEAGSGMTPLDVLCSVFTSVPRSELEEALHRSGYDFESAMGMLVSQHTYSRSGASTPQRVSSPRPMLGVGGRGAVPVHHSAPRDGYFQQGGRSFRGDISPGGFGARSPGLGGLGGLGASAAGNGGKMCRYFLAGECRRSDCRFSHDIDRALCRFWLRGHCAKGPNCEFLHQLPNNLDTTALTNAMSRVEISSDGYARPTTPTSYTPQEEFPDLLSVRGSRPGARFDPSRNRFANAVKRVTPAPVATLQVTGARLGPATATPFSPGQSVSAPLPAAAAVALPRPSQRIKLRPPTLLPTLKTGTSANEQYMTLRAAAIRLGHARNACLARAADAFRRGDGAAAKRFSREGKALNQRMINEAAEVAQTLVKARKEEAQKAIRERDPGWSDDPLDRTVRGQECGGGLGVLMGVASRSRLAAGDRGGGGGLSSDERAEALLDLHTLHGNEGVEVAGQFLVELERENFRGLAYIVVGEEKHVGTQDPLRGASKVRLGASVKQALAEWGYAWNENQGVVCVDPCRT